ncbi:hypothetical protein OsccyDRAFT_4080 [Leptolyngbyaceae cyanobacterium JSC-12]|nr:hypothetical protein OsccyDRAFT_4080 [Leptolyngbyaceae cyanobacterium JSC-12]
MNPEFDDQLPSQSSKTLLVGSAVPTTTLPGVNHTLLKNDALSSDHPPASQTLLIGSAVPTDPPPVNVYSVLNQAVPVENPPVSQTLLILDAIPTDPPCAYTTLLKDD